MSQVKEPEMRWNVGENAWTVYASWTGPTGRRIGVKKKFSARAAEPEFESNAPRGGVPDKGSATPADLRRYQTSKVSVVYPALPILPYDRSSQ